MKYITLLMDGVSDHPQESLGGKTPLQVAKKPNLDRLCALGRQGTLMPGVPELPIGSDVGNMAILGYDPRKYYSGRAPFEAFNLGVTLKKGEVAFRCNLVHVKDGIMDDYSAGHMSTEDGRELIKMLDKRMGNDKLRFVGGTQYRHITIIKGATYEGAKCTPPHDISGKPIEDFLPKGTNGKELRQLMEDSRLYLEGHEVNRERRAAGKKTGNMIWFWGHGKHVDLPSFESRFKLKGSVISAVDLIKGLGRSIGLDSIDVPGATGWLDSNFKGKAEAGLKALKKKDFLFLHLEATDEAGHKGDAAAKVKAIELIDEQVLGPLLEGLGKESFRLLVTPDHATPLELKTHALEPVPFFVYDSTQPVDGGSAYTEANAASTGRSLAEGWNLMPEFLQQAPAAALA